MHLHLCLYYKCILESSLKKILAVSRATVACPAADLDLTACSPVANQSARKGFDGRCMALQWFLDSHFVKFAVSLCRCSSFYYRFPTGFE